MQQYIYNEAFLEIKKKLSRFLLQWYGYGGLFPNNIVFMRELFQHLRYVNISGNNISLIPRDFGTLSTLQILDISNNNLEQYNDYSWSWLEQTAIKNNLLFLNLSKNLVSYIIKLIL